jgi:hypothetical protein
VSQVSQARVSQQGGENRGCLGHLVHRSASVCVGASTRSGRQYVDDLFVVVFGVLVICLWALVLIRYTSEHEAH